MRKAISIASDHAGFNLKKRIIAELEKLDFKIIDNGTFSEESVDYPDFAHKVGRDIENNIASVGIVICGSGNGVNMTVNKYRNVRSALCWNEEIARLARAHNDANVLALPARFINEDTAIKCVMVFLNTEFEGGRHEKRVKKIPPSEN